MNFKNFTESLGWVLESVKIIDNFPDMILYLDCDGLIINANQKAKDYFKLLSNVTISEIVKDGMKQIRQSIKYKKAVTVKMRNNNGEFYGELTAAKFESNYCISIRENTPLIYDMTEKDNIEKFNYEKNVMIHKIEDEIKSPINSILGFSQGLTDGIAGELTEKQTKYIKIINTNALDLKEIVDKFTEFSYFESSLYEPNIKKFDIISAFKDFLKDFTPKIDPSKVNIYFTYDDLENRNIYFDESILKKAIFNILEASLSMTSTGIISIHLSTPNEEDSLAFGLNEESKYLQITIKDTGTGIEFEEMKHVCNPYMQLDRGKKNILRSLRLGSASILVKRSNGFININSDIKQGTYYNIIIPIEKAQDE